MATRGAAKRAASVAVHQRSPWWSDGACGAQRLYVGTVPAQFGQDRIGVLAQRRHGVHARLKASVCARRQQRGNRPGRASPPRSSAGAPAAVGASRRRACRSCGHWRSARRRAAGDHLVGAQAPRRPSTMIVRSACALRPCAASSTRSARRWPASGWRRTSLQKTTHSRSFCKPEHHGLAVACGERAVGVDRGVRCAGAWRRRGAVEGVVQRVAHPLDHAFEHRHVDAAAARRCGRAGCSAARMLRVGIHAGGDVGDRAAGLRRLFGRAGDRQEARFALDQQVVGLLVAVRARVVPGRRRSPRCRRRSGPGCLSCSASYDRPKPRRGAGRQVLHQHVGLARAAGPGLRAPSRA